MTFTEEHEPTLERVKELIDYIDLYDFECVGGSLKLCVDWIEIKSIIETLINKE
jgi:hypothetical protein